MLLWHKAGALRERTTQPVIPLNVCPVERRCVRSTRSDGWPRCGECLGCNAEARYWEAHDA